MKFNELYNKFLNELTGTTTKDGDHTHTYEINEEGNGETSYDDGHIHKIENFKVLPAEDGHTHELEKEHILIDKDSLKESYIHEQEFVKWKNEKPKNYARKIMNHFGDPEVLDEYQAVWHNIAGFKKVVVKDEAIPHAVPVPHTDHVYSTIDLPTTPEEVGILANLSESIIVDQLKDEVTARCDLLIKNADTLGMCQDVVNRKVDVTNIKALQEEYERRILNDIYPDWYDDPLEEKGIAP